MTKNCLSTSLWFRLRQFGYRSGDTHENAQPTSLWLNMQSNYDLWHAEQRRKELRVESIIAA